MKKVSVILFVFILMIGVAYASDGWGDISSGDDVVVDSSDVVDTSSDVSEETADNPIDESPKNDYLNGDILPSFLDSEKYTNNFYIALGIGGIGILIVLLIIYLFIRRPKNNWKKRAPKKKAIKKKEKKSKRKNKLKK